MVRKKEIGFQGQFITLFIVGFSLFVYCFPHLSSLFVYHRSAILDGEIWRLFTAPFVHFSASHIFWDVLVFGVAGFAVNISGFRRFWIVCCLAAIIPGLLFLQVFPDLEYYGGLSGLATGAVTYYCLCAIFLTERKRQIWILILIFIAMKIFIEITLNESVFVRTGTANFRVLPSAHIVGCLGAIVALVWTSPQNPITHKKTKWRHQ
jgi:rhomboid family GlyGly-CTERM serine protease